MPTDSLALIHINHLDRCVAVLREVGTSVEPLLRSAGLPVLALGDPEAFVASRLLYRFLGTAARREGLDDLGLRSALQVPIGSDAWTATSLASAVTVHDALENLIRLGLAESPRMHFALRGNPRGTWIEYRSSADSTTTSATRIGEQYIVGALVAFLRAASGLAWSPTTVQLRAKSSVGLDRWEPLAHARLLTGGPMLRIFVPRQLLARPVATRGSVVSAAPAMTPDAEFVQDLRLALRPYLSEGLPKIRVAADIAGTSIRTLQRRLEGAGLDYSILTEQMRRERSQELVASTELRFIDVAHEVGFSDAAHFTRAFRRWTGTTPSAYRSESSGA